MNSQKGFSSTVILVAFLLLGAGFYAGSTSQKSLVADFSKLVTNLPSNISSKIPSIANPFSKYDFNAQPGTVQVKVNSEHGALDQNVLVELRTYNGVNTFKDRTREQDTKYVYKDSPIAEFSNVVPGHYKVSVMYGSLWNKPTDIEVKSGQLATITITVGNVNNSTPSSSDSADSYSSKSDENSVTIFGKYTIAEIDKVKYSVTFPKNGGAVTGSIEGTCNGSISGNVNAPDANKEAKFTGILEAKCNPIIQISYKVGVKANLEGTVDYNAGKVKILYLFSSPYSLRGYTELNFTP